MPNQHLELCASSALQERGRAHVWDVTLNGEAATAFALRFNGTVVAYVNRCVHVAAEMDWNVGEFLDQDRRHIVCALHGASYAPATGRCAGGPCGNGSLTRVKVQEVQGIITWYPSENIQPRAFAPKP